MSELNEFVDLCDRFERTVCKCLALAGVRWESDREMRNRLAAEGRPGTVKKPRRHFSVSNA